MMNLKRGLRRDEKGIGPLANAAGTSNSLIDLMMNMKRTGTMCLVEERERL